MINRAIKTSLLLIDDEENPRILLREYLQAYPFFSVLGECANGLEAIEAIDSLMPDIVFLDIQMPGANGFEVLQQVRFMPKVIFTTAYDSYAIKAFELNAVDYLLKPYTKSRFDKTVQRVSGYSPEMHQTGQPVKNIPPAALYPNRILVEAGKKMHNLCIQDIIYLKADKDYTEIHTASQYYLSSFGIGTIMYKLDPQVFIRIHRSYIININHVRELFRDISKTFVVLNNGVELVVGRHFQSALKPYFF